MKKFFTGAGMLAVAMVAAKLLGALYRIPLTNVLGAEGMGLYQMVFPLYTLLLTISSGGLPAAIARMVAVRQVQSKESAAVRVFVIALVAFSAFGLVCSGAILLFASPIAAAQGNPAAAPAYVGIAPAVFLVAGIACFRGYFQGRQNMLPSALSQLTEQTVKLAFGMLLAGYLLPYGLSYAVLGALIGVSLSELAALVVLGVLFLFTRRRVVSRDRKMQRRAQLLENTAELMPFAAPAPQPVEAASAQSAAKRLKPAHESAKSVLKELLKTALPITFGSLILPVTQMVDSMLLVNILTRAGETTAQATALYGLYNGIVMTVINMPVVVISALSVALMPRITRMLTANKDVHHEIAFHYKLMLVIGLFFGVLLAVLGGDLIRLLYAKGLTEPEIASAGLLLAISAVIVPIMCLIQLSTAVLQGYNRAARPAINLLIGAGVKVLLTATLTWFLGIYGALIGTVFCYVPAAALDVYALKKYSGFHLGRRTVSKLLLAALVAAGFTAGVWLLCRPLSLLWRLALPALLCAAVFIGMLLWLKAFTRHEIHRLLPIKTTIKE